MPFLPPGCALERVLSPRPESPVALVRRGSERLVLRVFSELRSLFPGVCPTARLGIPGLVEVVEWGETPTGGAYCLRPFVEGRTLDEVLRREGEAAALASTRSLLASLEGLHRAGFVHRDVKAENVIVGAGATFLVDLDLLEHAGGTVTGRAPSGSSGHIAPEVLLGQGHQAGSDLFSLGAMLAFAFCGPPSAAFHERFPATSFWNAAGLDPALLPPTLAPLVHACVRRHPADRPPSARAASQLLPGGGAAEPPERRLSFLAGREAALDEIADSIETAPSFALVVTTDPGETELLAREVRLALALRGIRVDLRGATGGEARPPAEARAAGAGTIRIAVVQEPQVAAEVLLERIAGEEPRGGVLILPRPLAEQAVSEARRALGGDDAPRFRTLRFPRVSPAALEDHLLRLTDGADPQTARRLARSLWRVSDGRYLDVVRRLEGAVAEGVLRPVGSAYAALLEEWPAEERAVDALFTARVEALGEAARGLLRAFAFLGPEATVERAATVSALSEAPFLAAWGELHRAGVFLPGVGPDGRPLPSDPRWLEAAATRSSGPSGTRAGAPEDRRLHAACARLLRAEQAPEGRVAWHLLACASRSADYQAVLDVAEHERRAGRLPSARRLAEGVLRRSTRLAGVRRRAATQIARLELAQGNAARALGCLEELHGPGLEEAPAATLTLAAEAAQTAGARARARELSERALRTATSPAERQEALVAVAYGAILDGSPGVALAELEARTEAPASAGHEAALENVRGGALAHLGELEEAARVLDRALVLARESEDPALAGRVELNRAFVDRRRGRFRESIAALRRARLAFDGTGDVKLRALAANNLGVLLRDLGDLRAAQAMLQESLRLRRRVGDAHGASSSQASLGIAVLDAGEIDAAVRLLEAAVEAFERGGHRTELDYVRLHLAAALSLAGRRDEAQALLEAAEGSGADATPDAARFHPLLFARARAALALGAGRRAQAIELLAAALAQDARPGEESERQRVAAWLLALRPADEPARETLRQMAAQLGSPARRLELEWLTCEEGLLSVESLTRWLAGFEAFGRTDLVRSASLVLADLLGQGGQPIQRRRVTARAAAAEDALAGSLPAPLRGLALAQLRELAGGPSARPRKLEIGVDWFLQWNRRLVLERDIEALLRATIDMALEVTGAHRGFLVLMREGAVEVQTARGLQRADMTPDQLRFSETVIKEAVREERPVITTDASHDQRFSSAKSVRSWHIRSVLCVPLFTADGLTGALYIDNDQVDSAFDDYDARIVASLADQAAIAITNLRRNQKIEALNRRLEERIALRDDELVRSRSLLREAGRVPPIGWLVGDSAAMQELGDQVERLAATTLSIRLRCASGSGEEGIARAIHERSPRAGGPFAWQNVRALPEHGLEEAFFGRERRPAVRGRRGLLAKAEGGTLFLADAFALPLEFQARLADSIESGAYLALGAGEPRRLDVRWVVSCHRPVEELLADGTLEERLCHLIGGAELVVPRLAERVQDVPALARAFVEELNRRHDGTKRIAPAVLAALVRRPWDGELRELRNEIARLYALAREDIDDPALVHGDRTATHAIEPMPASFRLEDVERAAIARALEAARHRKDQAAKLLGISRAGLYTKLKRLGMSPE